jgi:hypothetical protein
MEKKSFIFLIALLLSSCSPAMVLPISTTTSIATSTTTSTETSTLTPTHTPNPTLTLQPTVTETPTLPDTIKLTFDKSISQEIQKKIRSHVNEAYWYFISLGCSPEGFKAKFYIGKGGYSDFVNGGVYMEDGVSGKGTDLSTTEYGSMSHEIAHVMCQTAFTRRANMGNFDLRWLTEAVAINLSTMERIQNTGSDWGF